MQIKWSNRQRKAIEKVIKHYEYVLEDLFGRWDELYVANTCAFCQMYGCYIGSKCPNRVLKKEGCDAFPLMKRLDRNITSYQENKRGSEKWLRKAILARIEFWKGRLGWN